MTLGYIAETIINARSELWKWLDIITRKSADDTINITAREIQDLLNAMEELLEMVIKLETDGFSVKREES